MKVFFFNNKRKVYGCLLNKLAKCSWSELLSNPNWNFIIYKINILASSSQSWLYPIIIWGELRNAGSWSHLQESSFINSLVHSFTFSSMLIEHFLLVRSCFGLRIPAVDEPSRALPSWSFYSKNYIRSYLLRSCHSPMLTQRLLLYWHPEFPPQPREMGLLFITKGKRASIGPLYTHH